MPKFLSREELYRILQRELPEEVYADGAPSGAYTTADMDSVAHVFEGIYSNLSRIYDNFFPQTADEYILLWEFKVFGKYLPAGLTLQERRDRILARLRAKTSMSTPSMKAIVLGIIGQDKDVEILPLSSSNAFWILDYSLLDFNTFLGAVNFVNATGPGLCSADPADYGLTQEEWDEIRYYAYVYEVRIYSYTPTAEELVEIDEQLNIYEPARSKHIVLYGLDPADRLEGAE